MLTLRVPFVLASQSPRRRTLLTRLGLPITVAPSDADESGTEALAPAEAVEALARRKALAVAEAHPPGHLVLAADTTVFLDGEALNKPADPADAHRMLARLSGRTHVVYTGIALVHRATERLVVAHEATDVTFAALSDAEIAAYVATGSPLDKAGAYGIQDDHGALFVASIRGDYYNVVGLPLHRLYRTLREHFADLLA